MPPRRPGPPGLLPLCAFALVALAQLPLVANPGYFSHDELQWAAFAAEGRWFPWTATDALQYRPLTFNLWAWLSAALFATPPAFHAVLVAGGAANAALACLLARRLGAGPGPALAGAVLFGIGPQAMFVHGWVGTIGDVLWLGLALLAALAATARALPQVAAAFLVASATLLALLAKEAAVVVPALLALGAWLAAAPGSALRRGLAVATLAAGVVVAGYLALRLGVLLDAPREGRYALSAAHAPVRWVEQQLYPFDPAVFEVGTLLADGAGKRTAVAALAWLGVVAALARAGWRWALGFLLGGLAALAPGLPLAEGGNQYGYGFACVGTLVAACAWPRLARRWRAPLVLAAVLVAWHGVNVAREMRAVGALQARFSPAVAAALSARDGALRLRVADEGDRWIYARLVHEVPHYRGVRFGDRVTLVGPGEPADATVRGDGTLAPLR